MAAVPVTIVGIATYDDGTSGNLTLIGMASLTGLEVGGGPMPGGPPSVTPPPSGAHPAHPIALPGDPWWPVPPGENIPPPGSPPVIVPGTHPVNPMVPPDAVGIEYPGIGKVVVPRPLTGTPPAA